MRLFFITAMLWSTSLQSCSEIFKRTPFELIPRILDIRIRCIDIKRILELRLVCKAYDQLIITTIKNHSSLLESFYDFIRYKKRNHILKPEASFLNRFPNLRTHLNVEISEIYVYLFYQDFSFCTNDQDYAKLYEKQKTITFESLTLFDQNAQKGFFRINYAKKYGWFNHGINPTTIGRGCCFSQIGFLFFDLGFLPPSEFWNEPYHKDTINPVNVLISLAFNEFFKKALKSFVTKIPEYCKSKIINPVIVMSPPDMFFLQDFNKHFQSYTKPLLEKRLKNAQTKPKPQKPFTLFTKLKNVLKKWKFLTGISSFIVVSYALFQCFFKIRYKFLSFINKL